MRLASVGVIGLALGLWACGLDARHATTPTMAGCSSNADCKAPRICVIHVDAEFPVCDYVEGNGGTGGGSGAGGGGGVSCETLCTPANMKCAGYTNFDACVAGCEAVPLECDICVANLCAMGVTDFTPCVLNNSCPPTPGGG
jgi:hypothetical protein